MKEIELNHGMKALVSDVDFEILTSAGKWQVTKKGYARRCFYKNGKKFQLFMHRLITDAQPGEQVDHVNGNKLDNRRENLRICTGFENQRNTPKRARNTSGYKGVTWHKQHKKWYVQIWADRKLLRLGFFDDLIAAAKAYDDAARKYHGDFARPNFSLTGENL